jgi:glycosyltransferase involved in cell wall biosynthesis
MPDVTVIITTRNEEQNIVPCLESLHSQTIARNRLEILLVDNNSDDRTVEVSKPFIDNVFNKGPERSAQRNFGVEQASAAYVMYLDADMRLSPAVIEECLDAVQADPSITGIFVPETVVGTGYWINVRNFERSFYDATVIDAVRFIRRDIFLELGGFDLSLCGPEDWDLDRRLGERGGLHLISASLYHDEGAFNFAKYLKKKSYYARTFDAYRQKWHNDVIVRKQLGIYYRFIGVFIENGKWKRLIRHPLLGFGMYFLRFLVGCSYICAKKKA